MVTVMRPSRARVRKCNDTTPRAPCPNCVAPRRGRDGTPGTTERRPVLGTRLNALSVFVSPRQSRHDSARFTSRNSKSVCDFGATKDAIFGRKMPITVLLARKFQHGLPTVFVICSHLAH